MNGRYLQALALSVPMLASASPAASELPAARTLGPLCRIETDTVRLAWLTRSDCKAPASQVRILNRLPDTELISALQQHQKVLEQARLVFAGNSSCASQRAFNFVLTSIGVSAAGRQFEEMVEWGYTSDRKTSAKVWARKSGAGYDVWFVACDKAAS